MTLDASTAEDIEADLCSPAARTLCVGSLSRDEEAAIARQVPASRLWRRAEGLLDAQQILGEQPIERILLAQARPGQLPPSAPQQLADWAPDAELLSLAGDWCEGELRTGKPLTDVPRVYWHQLLGSTAATAASQRPLVLAAAPTYDAGQMWTDVLAALDYGCLATRRGRPEPLCSGERLAIWDGDQLDGREADRLADFCVLRRRRGARVIAVFDYPRGDVVQTALDLGACAVMGRPWTIEMLQQALSTALAPANSLPGSASPGLRLAA